jgi:hypothetical protein
VVKDVLTSNNILGSINGIEPPSFDLGISQIAVDHDTTDLSPQLQVHANLNANFTKVADPNLSVHKQEVVILVSTLKTVTRSIKGIDPPSFDLGLSQIDAKQHTEELVHLFSTYFSGISLNP